MNKKNSISAIISVSLTLIGLSAFSVTPVDVQSKADSDIYKLELKDINLKPVSMSSYKGKVLLIVNTASKCGFTPQFKDLQDLQAYYGEKGLQVLAFPSNDFKQDQGSNDDIKHFSEEKYGVQFPIFDKGHVAGDETQPLFTILKKQSGSIPEEVLWNFEKFLVNKKGKVVARYRSMTKPSNKDVVAKIEELLKEK